ncbi:hypothetical protein [Caballeronia sp. AZ7_KS35]|uniref:DUF6896 domain-containing protein n=1 Tax=Caballeronia sp. AZ7_KS35 TaxID=2921762 RepID=UPI0020297499|nr:hypothetical protein [Caballeronia sp. AZ7_KS35]
MPNLIADYQASVRSAVALMYRSGIELPSCSSDWIDSGIDLNGMLDGGIRYLKHGTGCAVFLPAGEVDFDFGRHGEINGIDPWKLLCFARDHLPSYGFTERSFKEAFAKAVQSGELVLSDDNLHYVANEPRAFAVEIDSTMPGDKLPSRNLDRVLDLYAHQYLAAELMRKNYDRLYDRWRKRRSLPATQTTELRIYCLSWLAYLRATCEGFEALRVRVLLLEDRPEEFVELVPDADAIGKAMKRHSDLLRRVRNNVFHLRSDVDVVRRFFIEGADRLAWAREVHLAFADFFSSYRVLCEVHYMVNGRYGELTRGRRGTARASGIGRHKESSVG